MSARANRDSNQTFLPGDSDFPRDGARSGYGRIGLLGDIHAEDVLLERALDFLAARQVELIVATGDVADGPGSVDRCCELLQAHAVVVVRGNHDRCFVAGTARDLPHATPVHAVSAAAQRQLAQLPSTVSFETKTGRALLCHGLGDDDMAKVAPADEPHGLVDDRLEALLRGPQPPRWILNGHSHRRLVRSFAGTTLINAGTLRRDHQPGFLEIDFARPIATPFDFDPTGRITPGGPPIALPLFDRRADGLAAQPALGDDFDV
jgi:predicted phosphodiesterase